MRIRTATLGLCAAGIITGFAGAATAAEVTVRAVSPWPKTNTLTKSFLRFIDKTNTAGKGVLQIKFMGGPEVTRPREQPIALRNGLFDMIYGPPGYYLGLLPEGDFFQGLKTPMEMRANGAYDMIRPVMKQKMGARFIARFDSGMGLHMWTKTEPKRTASGGIDLTGLKLRGSPTYRNFIKDLGGTAVIMRPSGVYTALERGVIDGMGMALTDVRDRGLQKFIKYRIDPPFTYAGIALIMNHKVWDKMPKAAQAFLDKQAIAYEIESRNYWEAASKREAAELAKLGMKTVDLTGKTAQEYRDTFLSGPWKRMANNPKVKLDVAKLKKLSY